MLDLFEGQKYVFFFVGKIKKQLHMNHIRIEFSHQKQNHFSNSLFMFHEQTISLQLLTIFF